MGQDVIFLDLVVAMEILGSGGGPGKVKAVMGGRLVPLLLSTRSQIGPQAGVHHFLTP